MKFHSMYIKERAQMKGQFMKIGFSLGTKKRKTEQTNGLKWTFDSSNSVFSSLRRRLAMDFLYNLDMRAYIEMD